MKYTLVIFVISFFFLSSITAQEKIYHRIRINLENKNPLILVKNGLAIDHGKMAIGRYFEGDFSTDEIKFINDLGFETKVLIHDVESYYANQDRPSELVDHFNSERFTKCIQSTINYKTPVNYFEGSMGGYFTYEEMIVILETMQLTHPHIVSNLNSINGYKTHEGETIKYLKVSDNPNIEEDEPEILYTAIHHAREPNALSQMIFYLWFLCENYAINPEIKYLVDNTEMFFVPCLNPDGYKINEKNKPQGGGLWRKNARKDNTGKLIGVDLNRNYGYQWAYDNTGSSGNPNSDTYRGPSAFSEPETSALRELCVAHNFIMTLNYHTYGNLLVHPWGYSDSITDEDELFKALGKVMNKENNFKLGTGTETVGYTVNGDSDDYMYGERIEKNKIYSFTPEVGPSFWPKKNEIDKLNKSCINMNLSLPRLATNVIFTEHLAETTEFDTIGLVKVKFSKPSFKMNETQVSIYIDGIYGNQAINTTLNLKQLKDTILELPYKISYKDLKIGRNEVKFYTVLDYGDYRTIDSFYIDIFNGDREILFNDSCDWILKYFPDTQWGLTSLPGNFTSAPSAITDSPNAVYAKNQNNTIKFITPFDLSEAKSPYLTFKARWNIEDNFDYARIYVHTPQKDTIYLCGKFTSNGTADQAPGFPIYDGNQDQFISEIMSLEEVEGKPEVYLNIEMVADDFLELDGIYIDDVQVISFKEKDTVDSNEDIYSREIKISPNPSLGIFSLDKLIQNGKYTCHDMAGKIVSQGKLTQTSQLDLSNLKNGLYILKIVEGSSNYKSKIVINY